MKRSVVKGRRKIKWMQEEVEQQNRAAVFLGAAGEVPLLRRALRRKQESSRHCKGTEWISQ